jgi:hypothetical protein
MRSFLWSAIILSGLFLGLNCNEGPSDSEATPTPSNSTSTPTSSQTTPTPTGSPQATPTQTESFDGHWLGDVYLYNMIGPCQTIEFYVDGAAVTGSLYWTVGTGDPDLNATCTNDAGGNPITWSRQEFTAVLSDREFEWSQGSQVPPDGVMGFFGSSTHCTGGWYHHPDEDNINFGEWIATKQ